MKGAAAPPESNQLVHSEWDGGDQVPSPTISRQTPSSLKVAHHETSVASNSYQRQVTAERERLESSSKDYEAEQDEDQDSSSSESTYPRAVPRKQKRKREVEVLVKVAGMKSPSVKKKSHNVVEKRYRTNLNDKIAALRDSVPSLRMSTPSIEDPVRGLPENVKDLQVPTPPSQKLNKNTVLSKAIEYIQYLERRNRCLLEENSMLRNQKDNFVHHQHLDAAETIGPENGDITGDSVSAPPAQLRTTIKTSTSLSMGPRGMISVPENISKLRIRSQQGHYADYRNSQALRSRSFDLGEDAARDPSKEPMSKLMVGTFAGLW